MPLPSVIVETGPRPVGTVIWLHGLGADGHDFEPIVPELRLPAGLSLRFVFPHAPVRPVTVNGGLEMRAWYDILSLDSQGRADAGGVLESSAALDELITAEIDRGTSPADIVLAGFSQGGAIVLHNALSSPRPLAGLMALSTYLALPQEVAHAPAGYTLPLFMAHGTQDNMVPYGAGMRSAEYLRAQGYVVDWHEYPMGHGVCPAEISDISAWLASVFLRSQPAS
jgi:phospholipase/carboxylesterase